jgi:hypothetical protein
VTRERVGPLSHQIVVPDGLDAPIRDTWATRRMTP